MRSVLTIGTFDGVHLGHKKIFQTVVRLAKKSGLVPTAVTFDIPPRLFFFPSKDAALLTTVREKVDLLKRQGIEKVVVLEFDRKRAQVSAQEFFQKVIVERCRPSAIVVGYNFGFGKNREGDTRFLEEMGIRSGIRVQVVPPVTQKNVPVSSGRIRDLLKAGDLKSANALLGAPYFVTGKVVHGRNLGARLGFPTANLSVPPEKIVPLGVFAVKVAGASAKTFAGMCNVGFRPTVMKGSALAQRSVEVHLLGFSGNLYGKTLRLEFIKKIRDEKRFPNLEALKSQIAQDQQAVRASLSKFLHT